MTRALNPQQVARSFGAASARYDDAALLQAQVRDELLSRLDALHPQPATVLDLGCGTGAAAAALKKRYPRARVIAADIAPGMLAVARQRSRFWRRFECIEADAHRLPLPVASVDLIFTNLMLQWADPLDAALAEIARVLRPGGLLLASSFGPETLQQLRWAWREADDAVHVNHFVDMHDFGSALQRAGFTEPVLDVDRHTRFEPDVDRLMAGLKAIGAHNVNAQRPRGLTGRHRMQRMRAAYERLRTPQGLPVTWQVVYAVAWAPAHAQRGEAMPVTPETRVSLAAMQAGLSRSARR
ncbi:MAG: malonyl-ACP O-methyltransferase BioC [Nevskiaceae bacterium]|jgi:malonyl-CoA O-methyltransferase|nr:malonyl-ACP O-methyltransferase BioC [Nevskiaceae bacterium]